MKVSAAEPIPVKIKPSQLSVIKEDLLMVMEGLAEGATIGLWDRNNPNALIAQLRLVANDEYWDYVLDKNMKDEGLDFWANVRKDTLERLGAWDAITAH